MHIFWTQKLPRRGKSEAEKSIRGVDSQKRSESVLFRDNGNFDFYIYQVLCELEKKYPEIRFTVVLAYMPCKKRQGDTFDWYRTTIYPKGIEKIPIRFALSFRNKWMIERSDSAATYILYSSGGAVCGACRKKRKDLYQFTGIDLKYFT